MAVNQQRKAAIKRLMTDMEELKNHPVANVSANPLDEDMLEWHCNFNYEGIIYHLILFFPDNYPYKSPSAEFMPPGFRFNSGATKQGRKGTQICLSIFSDFEHYHTEWAGEKSMGWSPGYSVQTVLMNLVAFMADESSNASHNERLALEFCCSDCGHSATKPFPPIQTEVRSSSDCESGTDVPQIVDYMSKRHFSNKKPRSRNELFGYGLVKGGSRYKPSLTTPCEFLTAESYYGMLDAVGKAHSSMKDELSFFLPMYITADHGEEIKKTFEATMRQLAGILPNCDHDSRMEDLILKTIPNLMNTTVVEFSKGSQHTSDNHLSGYFALHRLLLWTIKTYPRLKLIIDDKIQEFVNNPEKRTKKSCPNVGEWLMFLAGSSRYRWKDVASAYLGESWRRNVMWYVKDDVKLGMLNTDQHYRLQKTLPATAVSRKLLAFQVLFLDIAMPAEMSLDDIVARYDNNYGFPTDSMVAEMKAACHQLAEMKTYTDWYKIIKIDAPSDDVQFTTLVESVKYATHTESYYWSSPNGAGGWTEVLQAYNPSALLSNSQNRQYSGQGQRQSHGPYSGNQNRYRGNHGDYGNRRGQWRPR